MILEKLWELNFRDQLQRSILFPIFCEFITNLFETKHSSISRQKCISIVCHLSFVACCRTVIWFTAEVPRLVAGRSGNVEENISRLSAFIFLTMFPQVPAVIYFAFYQEMCFPMDRAVGITMIIFLSCGLLLGCITIQSFVKRQTREFYQSCREKQDWMWEVNRKNEAELLYWSRDLNASREHHFKEAKYDG